MTDKTAAKWVPVADLVPWPGNPRANDGAVAAVAQSIERFGWGAVVLARKENREIIAGHTRVRAALHLGMDRVPVRYLDISEDEAHALALADNKLAEIAGWSDGLADVLRDLQGASVDLAGLGWSTDDLVDLLHVDAQPGDDPPPLPADPDSELGCVYELGPHRLICGDSTDATVWDALLQGDRLRAVWTDPPYGIAVVGGFRALTPAERLASGGKTLENDDLSTAELRSLLFAALGLCLKHCQPGAAWYVAAPPGALFYEFATVLRELGVWRWTLLWVKDALVMGRADYHHRHEPIFYGWTPGAAHYFVDDRTQDTVFEVPRPKRSADHPTMKPVELVVQQLRNSTRTDWLVGDPFGGSGTTLMASAILGLRARVIELDPRYCDVIRRRWTTWAIESNRDPGKGALHD